MRARLSLLLILLSVIGCGGMGSAEAERARKAEQQAKMMADRAMQAEAEAQREIDNSQNVIKQLKSENEELQQTINELREDLKQLQASNREERQPATQPKATGSLAGQVIIGGEPPKLPPLVAQGANVRDSEICAAAEIPNESLIVGPDGGLANVIVYLAKPPDGYVPPPLHDRQIVFDRIACRFIPHVLVLRTGQQVLVKNSDPIAHNVHTKPRLNKPYNQAMKAKSDAADPIEYARAELLPVQVTCDFHAWMQAWHLPLDHPFAAVTDAKGRFEIQGLPVGEHEFRLWHESAGLLEMRLRVTIEADQQANLELKYSAERFK